MLISVTRIRHEMDRVKGMWCLANGSSERHMVSSKSKHVAEQSTGVLSLNCAVDPFENGKIYGPLLRKNVFKFIHSFIQ